MNACIVGYGAIGSIHAKIAAKLNGVTVYAICDVIKERADEGAGRFGAKAYYDFDDCLKDQNITHIHICTPHYLHYEMIKKTLAAGKNVIVEKPAVMKKDEFSDILLHADVKSVFPIMQNRANACIVKLKEIIASDPEIGALKGVKGILTWCRDAAYYQSESWRGTATREGGGVLINQAVHTLDLMVYLGGKVKSVNASERNDTLKGIIDVEDTISAYLGFQNGACGIFYATNAYCRNSDVLLELVFENKVFLYTGGTLYANGTVLCLDSDAFNGKSYWGSGHLLTLSDYYEKQSDFSLTDVKDTMDTLFAIYESAEQQKEIYL